MTAAADQSGDNKNKPTVLIVDDSKVVRVSMKKILGEIYNVIEAEDGEDGWMRVRSHDDIRCIFTDFSMPELDGFGLLTRIKGSSNPRINKLPVILVTGNEDDDSIRTKAKEKGFADVVIKPFKPSQIRQCVGRYFPELQQAAVPTESLPTDGMEVMRKEVERLKGQAAVFLKRAEQAERVKLELDQEVVRYKAELEVAKLESASSGRDQQDMRKAKEEIARIQSQLLSITNRAESAEAAHRKADQEIGELQSEMGRRQHEYAEQQLNRDDQSKSIQEELSRARSKVEVVDLARQKAEDEVKQLRTELMLRQQGAETEKSERIDKLRAEITALHQDLEEARDKGQAARQIRKQVEQELQRIQSENEAMNERYKAEEEEHERAKRMVERLREDREAAVARAESAEESLAQAEQVVEMYKADISELKVEEKEVNSVREEMASLRGEFDSLRIEKEAAEASQSELENELVSLSSSVEEMERLKDAAEGRAIELQAALNDRREDEIKLRKEMAEAKHAAAAREASVGEIRKPAPANKASDPVAAEMDQAFASLNDEGIKARKEEDSDADEVIELSGFWPEGQSLDDAASSGLDSKRIPTAIRSSRPREPEVMSRGGGGMLLKAAVILLLVAIGGSGVAWVLGLLPEDDVSVANDPKERAEKAVTDASRVNPDKALPKSQSKPIAKATQADAEKAKARSGAVERSSAQESRTEAELVSAPAEVEAVAESVAEESAPKPMAAESPEQESAKTLSAVSTDLARAVSEIPSGQPGQGTPIAALDSPFKDREAQVRAEAEAEFERLMKVQKDGVIPSTE